MNVAAYARLLPDITADNQPFWDGCAAGELRLQTCGECGTHRFPEAPVCPRCLSRACVWQAVSGTGTLWSWITMHQKYFPAFADEVPYRVAYIKLTEGPFMVGALVGSQDGPEPEPDQPVRAVFGPDATGRHVVRFAVQPSMERKVTAR
ncbi:OB-fold domain-containing protein [Spongiactinospora sp. TRM90649]|uniref:Zn-ribbon domain-containing OB-fold protein n=1 Tax=Spongiactinospora sp. TRM90649 TaxID=3031114 RepID=UPI0023F66D8F|nr:OB-fold domain-containing protein [Spongiactinospora sp. TRM90649]MDF5754326.1 OB-fold domain-containing protein [Spongiactinospora sp. TRM90649]